MPVGDGHRSPCLVMSHTDECKCPIHVHTHTPCVALNIYKKYWVFLHQIKYKYITTKSLTSLILGDSCAPVCDPPPAGGGVVVASRSAMLLVLSSRDCELMVAPVRFTPDCAPVLLFDCLGHPTFCFAIWYHCCKMPLIKLLCNELLISPLLQ